MAMVNGVIDIWSSSLSVPAAAMGCAAPIGFGTGAVAGGGLLPTGDRRHGATTRDCKGGNRAPPREPSAELAEEGADIGDQQLGLFVGREVAAAIEGGPADDLPVITLRETADATEVAPE